VVYLLKHVSNVNKAIFRAATLIVAHQIWSWYSGRWPPVGCCTWAVGS